MRLGHNSLISVTGILVMSPFHWLATPAGIVKTLFAGALGVLAGLLSLEVAPMAGLLILVFFEAATDLLIIERRYPPDHDKAGEKLPFFPRLLDVLLARVWVVMSIGAGIVYANMSGLESVKMFLVTVCGGILLLAGWYRAGRKAPIINIMAGALVNRLKGHGLDLGVEDEEGRAINISAQIKTATVTDESNSSQTASNLPGTSANPESPGN